VFTGDVGRCVGTVHIFYILFSFSLSLSLSLFSPYAAPFASFVVITRNRRLFLTLFMLLAAPAAACHNCDRTLYACSLTISGAARIREDSVTPNERSNRRADDRHLDTFREIIRLIAKVASSRRWRISLAVSPRAAATLGGDKQRPKNTQKYQPAATLHLIKPPPVSVARISAPSLIPPHPGLSFNLQVLSARASYRETRPTNHPPFRRPREAENLRAR